MRVKSNVAKDPGQNNLLNYQYTYDKMNNITDKTIEHGNYDYGYDDLYRLITADNLVQEDEVFTLISFLSFLSHSLEGSLPCYGTCVNNIVDAQAACPYSFS